MPHPADLSRALRSARSLRRALAALALPAALAAACPGESAGEAGHPVAARAPGPPRAAAVVPDFVIENAVPNVGFNNPVAIAFTPDRRLLVAEKRGVVRVVQNGVKLPAYLWDGTREVLANGDRGLLALAVDPDFAVQPWIYLLYVVDPDSNGVDDDDDAFGRLVRYRLSASDPNRVDPDTRQVLIGATWNDGFVSGGGSHAVGALRWGADGSLLVSWGDGAQYSEPDAGGYDPGLFLPGRFDPAQDIGAFRAQLLSSLNAKVLRIDPDTGEGYPGNPFYDGDPRSNRSRVWVYGCRNPFRFCVRPGTGSPDPAENDPGTLLIGDVGWLHWDEVNVSRQGGENWGWPCFEGDGPVPQYRTVEPDHHGCGSIGAPDNPAPPSGPTIAVSLEDPGSSTAGLQGRCVIAGVFSTGASYPPAYRNRFFFADFVAEWIKVAELDADDRLVSIADFADGVAGPTDFAVDPASGDVHFASIETGQVHRIRYTGPVAGNLPPVASAAASRSGGPIPLAVDFSSAGSHDPEQDPLAFAWSFGDGAGSTEPHPSHTYAVGGIYDAVLTVTDLHGALARDTVRVLAFTPSSFPATPVIDDFERPDGPLGAPWVGNIGGLAVAGGALVQSSNSSYAIWNGAVFGPEQEVHAVFDPASDGTEQSLLLKVQGTSWQDGHVQVHYDTQFGGALILTYDRGAGWRRIGSAIPMTLQPGDRFGGRAYSNGTIEVYRNGARAGSASVASWPFAAAGGRLGLLLTRAHDMRMTEFGGGDLVLDANTPPRATILAPAGPTFYAAGDTVRLAGSGADAEDPADQLIPRWEVDLHHNQHVHPAVVVADSAAAWFVAEDHDDGTGVWLRARFIVADRGGRADTARADLYPEIDLLPSVAGTVPTEPGTAEPALYRFTIDNPGRMPAPFTRWRLLAGSRLLAEGDTLVPAHGRVMVTRTLPPVLEPGVHDLRVVVDTLGAVVETDEANNAATRTLRVVEGAGVLDAAAAPRALALSPAFPNPGTAAVGFTLELPAAAAVEIAVFDVQGRELWRPAPRRLGPGRWTLEWRRESAGRRAGAGIYLARVRVGSAVMVRRFAMID